MPSLDVLRVVLREVTTRSQVARTPEPHLVMDDPDEVAAFHQAGSATGVMAPVYLFHASHASDVIRASDSVLDLGCGPANQLALVARANPGARFTGVDLSEEMLAIARARVEREKLANVGFHRASMTDLSDFADDTFDAVISTVALHHLPTKKDLMQTFSEVARVLKPDGGMYIVDFGRLKSVASMQFFAYQRNELQPPLFTLDYLNSLLAAFSLADFRDAHAAHLADYSRMYSTFLVPFMVAFKSRTRGRRSSDECGQVLKAARQALTPEYERDLNDLTAFFRMGGLVTNL